MRDRLEDLRVKLQDVINLVMESNNQIAVAKAHGEEGKRNVEKAKQVIERARESLKVTKHQLSDPVVITYATEYEGRAFESL